MEKKRILLVDDDDDFTEATRLILQSKSYEVIVACNGKDGLRKARSERPDLIILDVMMPEMDGYAVCRTLKSEAQYCRIPILLLTAVGESMPTSGYTKEMGMRTEADDYVPKPVELTDLVERVEKLFRISEPANG